MHVIATAGHVDHGKSTLVRALTGMEPDRWEEERRRGLSIGLGFAWTTLPGGEHLAFVDVPGHERFVPTMLAGVGPAPAALLVVAADEGWMPQSTEHLAALDAFGVRHGLLVVTRCDLADPDAARVDAMAHIAATSLHGIDAVAVSAVTGEGLDALRSRLARLVDSLPVPEPAADVRLWIDRRFTIAGAGTVVTGTLARGTLRVGDRLVLTRTGRQVRVRGLHVAGRPVSVAHPVARVAVNLRGVERAAVRPGDALLTPDAWYLADVIDVACRAGGEETVLPRHLILHIGSAAVPVQVRQLGPATRRPDGGYVVMARLRLNRALPLRGGDRLLLRDPGRHEVATAADVLDLRPPALARRGAAASRARDLQAAQSTTAGPTEAYLRHRGHAHADELRAMGLPAPRAESAAGGWYLDEDRQAELVQQLVDEVDAWQHGHPLESGIPAEVLRQRLGLPDPDLLAPLVRAAGLLLVSTRVHRPGDSPALPVHVEQGVRVIETALRRQPFAAPDTELLARLGIGARELAAAVRAGRLHHVGDGIVLLPDAQQHAVSILAGLPQPFTASQARQALGTTRRVALPLLQHLDSQGITQRLPDATRILAEAS